MQKAACWPVASIPPDCLRGFNSLGLEGGNYLRFPRMDVLSNGIFNFTENLLVFFCPLLINLMLLVV